MLYLNSEHQILIFLQLLHQVLILTCPLQEEEESGEVVFPSQENIHVRQEQEKKQEVPSSLLPLRAISSCPLASPPVLPGQLLAKEQEAASCPLAPAPGLSCGSVLASLESLVARRPGFPVARLWDSLVSRRQVRSITYLGEIALETRGKPVTWEGQEPPRCVLVFVLVLVLILVSHIGRLTCLGSRRHPVVSILSCLQGASLKSRTSLRLRTFFDDSGLVWSGLVWSGLVWSGLVWSGLVWSGLVWSGLVWCIPSENV